MPNLLLAVLIKCTKGDNGLFHKNFVSSPCRGVVTIARPFLARMLGPAQAKTRIFFRRSLCTTGAPFVSSHFTVGEDAIKEVLNRLRIKYAPSACALIRAQLILDVFFNQGTRRQTLPI